MSRILDIQKDRIISIDDFVLKRAEEIDRYYELDIDVSNISIEITSGELLITDPNYLADIFNGEGRKEKYLKKNGILLMDFGGDVSGPVFRTNCGGLKIVLVFDHIDENGNPLNDEEPANELNTHRIKSDNLGSDSGSYIFLDYNNKFKKLFAAELEENRKIGNGLFVVSMPNGTYNVGYEQWDTDEENPYDYLRRNLIVWPADV